MIEIYAMFIGGLVVLAAVSAMYATKYKKWKKLFYEQLDQTGENLEMYYKERDKYKKLLSQKKSSETRLGQISENLIPFLDGCPYDPKTMHFLGNPLDYLVFDLDEGKIVFLEIKSGNSRASKKQKTIKQLIQQGHVYYEEMRINEKGVKSKKAKNSK